MRENFQTGSGAVASTQQALDGSPAVVTRTLLELWSAGKFSGHAIPLDHEHDEVLRIQFQCGPLQEVSANGCAIEDVIEVLIERLEGFQKGPFACKENGRAIDYLSLARLALTERTRIRVAQGVEGTNAAHVSKP